MTKKQRSEACRELLHARGAISCFFPVGQNWEKNLHQDCVMNGIRAGNLQRNLEGIDKVLDMLGHIGGGSVK